MIDTSFAILEDTIYKSVAIVHHNVEESSSQIKIARAASGSIQPFRIDNNTHTSFFCSSSSSSLPGGFFLLKLTTQVCSAQLISQW